MNYLIPYNKSIVMRSSQNVAINTSSSETFHR
jgi:hypothetical protein